MMGDQPSPLSVLTWARQSGGIDNRMEAVPSVSCRNPSAGIMLSPSSMNSHASQPYLFTACPSQVCRSPPPPAAVYSNTIMVSHKYLTFNTQLPSGETCGYSTTSFSVVMTRVVTTFTV